MPEVVYKSAHPDVLAHWENTASTSAQRQWRETVEETIADLGFLGRRFATQGSTRVIGVEHPQDEDIPEGWRRDRSLPEAIVPALRTSAGRKIDARLATLTRPDPRKDLPGGMPEVGFDMRRFAYPGVAKHGDAVYVTWSIDPAVSDADKIDPAVWQRIKLSEYYAALEAEEAKTS
ncbi:hypothetical protein GCM10023085_45950 [Actinomadura viridis]|uniref:Uncharacterized protein n=1 Tax=Actinomadura viridis TaxID=58110 RepID=A0A931DMR0_9ACTN|nr:hypothetical protein [Actinomadura viridis]MBG6089955.1 hypothetical protein [Actinomadura viridis]